MKSNPFVASAVLALVLALGISVRVNSHYESFQSVVKEALATSDGYDQKFLELVNHLEEVLTTRASFPYPGGKDPMTGRRREVAVMVAPPRQSPPQKKTASTAKAPSAPSKVVENEEPKDRVRLTAIIADDYGQHTAIVMDGERSLSVDVGDSVGDRKVTRITGKELTMEDATTVFIYGLTGAKTQQRK